MTISLKPTEVYQNPKPYISGFRLAVYGWLFISEESAKIYDSREEAILQPLTSPSIKIEDKDLFKAIQSKVPLVENNFYLDEVSLCCWIKSPEKPLIAHECWDILLTRNNTEYQIDIGNGDPFGWK